MKFIDGYCYTGYLWDCLKEPQLITIEELEIDLKVKDIIFVLWDIHSNQRIFIEDYWKFGIRSAITLKADIMIDNLQYLHVYLFDEGLKWTLILTHEDIEGNQICFKVMENEKILD